MLFVTAHAFQAPAGWCKADEYILAESEGGLSMRHMSHGKARLQ